MSPLGQLVYLGDQIEGASAETLGSKGYNLYKRIHAGYPVPPAYVITPEVCRQYLMFPEFNMKWVHDVVYPSVIHGMEKEFGYVPLFSVRSGAAVSLPGMLDTVLNVGLDELNLKIWRKSLGKACVENCGANLVEMYGGVVAGIERAQFAGLNYAQRLVAYKACIGQPFPSREAQMLDAIEAVFKSWNNPRAIAYRNMKGISHDMGTAVVIQAMVFGNRDEKSCTGVVFSRNPSDGNNELLGEFSVGKQGEYVVDGSADQAKLRPISELWKWNPKVAKELHDVVTAIEAEERDLQEVEFTVDHGKLWVLQNRAPARMARAAIKIAVDLCRDAEAITPEEALKRVTLKQFLSATSPFIPENWVLQNPPHAVGIAASSGCMTGVAVFTSEQAVASKELCILVTDATEPKDIEGINAAVGILTRTGGKTCHAAVVARGMEKVCVVGCSGLVPMVEAAKGWVLSDGNVSRPLKAGDRVTLDGSTGRVWINVEVPIEAGAAFPELRLFSKMLEQHHGIYSTCENLSDLAAAQRVLLATYSLDRIYSGVALRKMFAMMLANLGERDAIVDLRTYRDLVREADEPLEFMWGELQDNATAINIKLSALIEHAPALSGTVKVLGAGLTEAMIGLLKQNGFTVIPQVRTLLELIEVDGLCAPDFDYLESGGYEPLVAGIVELKKKAGQQLRSFNIVQTISAEQLHRSAQFALSPMQAAQCLLPPG